MKYDLTKKPTRGAQRTLDAFSTTLFTLIAEKPFEEVSIQQLCERSNYPRATFYNYFDDKFDLLNYCFYLLAKEIKLDEFKEIKPKELLHTYFDRCYELMDPKKDFIFKILKHNNQNSTAITSFIAFLRKQMRVIFLACLNQDTNLQHAVLPMKLLADHYTNTILLVFEWVFFERNETTKKEAQTYLDCLLTNIDLI
ncbi:MAG: TetR/AcrR family transcriptional regulator [Enterococcus sp.]